MKYVKFTSDMLKDASHLLAIQHQNHRKKLPILPSRFEDPSLCLKAVASLLEKENAEGVAATRNGRLSAYLIGVTVIEAWGRCGYIYLGGCGLGETETPQILQDLYALLGESWNQKGFFNHYIYLSSADKEGIETWFNLGFGKERIDALLALESLPIPDITPPEGITIRRVNKDDGFYLASLSDTIWKHQTKAPRWHPTLPEEAKAQTSGWAEIAETPSDMAYLAFEGEELLGSIAFYVQEETERDFLTPAKCRYMTAAAIKETARGRGLGSLLTWHGLKQIREHGDTYCLTNWQSANLLAARFWPRFGFEPVAYRLARQIRSSIAWAKAD